MRKSKGEVLLDDDRSNFRSHAEVSRNVPGTEGEESRTLRVHVGLVVLV